MNQVILSLANGSAFFVGLILVVVAEGLLFRFKNRFTRSVFTILTILGIILVIVSAAPLSIWLYGIWIILAIAGLFLLHFADPPRRISINCGSALLLVTLALGVTEAQYHSGPTVTVPAGATVYVLGDSISAGMGTEQPWPALLSEMKNFRIVNLARAGATVESAFVQAKAIAEPGSFVILEVGGNDLIGGTSVAAFRSKLDSLISMLRADQHEIVLLELPLLPFKNGYGKAQRDAVRKHGVTLLPKRFFVRVLGAQNGTIDGLHLSQAGHNAMAQMIAEVLNQEADTF